MSDSNSTPPPPGTPTTTAVDPEQIRMAVKRFDWVLAFMTLNDRYNYEILGRMQRIPLSITQCPTMGVGPQGLEIVLTYSPEFASGLEDEELRWVLSHEVLHVSFHHVTLRSPKDRREADLDNAAADLAINSLLGQGHNGKIPYAREDKIDKKTGKVKVKKGDPWVLLPSQYGFPEKLSMEVYRELLREHYQANPDQLKDDMEGRMCDDHSGWHPSDVGDATINDWIERIGRSGSWGHLPADTIAAIKAAQVSEVAWDKELRWYLGRMESSVRRHTYRKPNRRVGYPWSGVIKETGDVPLFAPDTSASVDDGNLAKFLAEFNSAAARRPFDYMCWSSGLTMPKPIRWDRKRDTLEFRGRGGTDPQPVINFAAENGYHQLIMLSDGEFGCPVVPPGLDILWVITADGVTSALPPGSRVVQMKKRR